MTVETTALTNEDVSDVEISIRSHLSGFWVLD